MAMKIQTIESDKSGGCKCKDTNCKPNSITKELINQLEQVRNKTDTH